MSTYENLKDELRAAPRKWLLPGVAGFIGSNLLETLLKLDQRVIGLDNFAARKRTSTKSGDRSRRHNGRLSIIALAIQGTGESSAAHSFTRPQYLADHPRELPRQITVTSEGSQSRAGRVQWVSLGI